MEDGWDFSFKVVLDFLILNSPSSIYSHINVHKSDALLTLQEVIKTEHIDLAFPLHWVRPTLLRHAWAGPEYFALAQTHSVDILALDLQDEATVHHI